jgi:Family of unknown function (DUF6263)
MNKQHLFCIAAATLIMVGTGCNKAGKLSKPSKFTPPTGPVKLKLKWMPGERVVQDMDMKTKMDIDMPGQPAPMHQDITMGEKYALTVLKETPDGGHEVEMEFLSARMDVEAAGKTVINYDSTKKSGEDGKNPMADMFSKIIGCKIQVFMDANNNVDRIEGVHEMMNRLSAGGANAALAPLKSMFSEGYFKQMMSSSRFMPPNAVAPGDTWPVRLEFPMGPLGTFVLDYTFTFQGWETHGVRNCARLEFQGEIKTKPGSAPSPTGMTMDIQNGTTSGVSWFDPELGIIIDTVMNQDMTMDMALPRNPYGKPGTDSQPKKITSQMNQVINIKLDSVE